MGESFFWFFLCCFFLATFADIYPLQNISKMNIPLLSRHFRFFRKSLSSQNALSLENFYPVLISSSFLVILFFFFFFSHLFCYFLFLLLQRILCWSGRSKLSWISQEHIIAAFASQIFSAYGTVICYAPITNDRSLQTRQSCRGWWISRSHPWNLQIEHLFTTSSMVFTV